MWLQQTALCAAAEPERWATELQAVHLARLVTVMTFDDWALGRMSEVVFASEVKYD
jgi:hypothetical protein